MGNRLPCRPPSKIRPPWRNSPSCWAPRIERGQAVTRAAKRTGGANKRRQTAPITALVRPATPPLRSKMPTRRAGAPARLPLTPVRPASAFWTTMEVATAAACDQNDGAGATDPRNHRRCRLGWDDQRRRHDQAKKCLHFRLLSRHHRGDVDCEVILASAVSRTPWRTTPNHSRVMRLVSSGFTATTFLTISRWPCNKESRYDVVTKSVSFRGSGDRPSSGMPPKSARCRGTSSSTFQESGPEQWRDRSPDARPDDAVRGKFFCPNIKSWIHSP